MAPLIRRLGCGELVEPSGCVSPDDANALTDPNTASRATTVSTTGNVRDSVQLTSSCGTADAGGLSMKIHEQPGVAHIAPASSAATARISAACGAAVTPAA